MSEFKTYHGCYSGYKDGTKILIEKDRLCLHATNEPFWKLTQHVQNKVKTRLMVRRKKRVKAKYMNKYYDNLE